MATINMHMKFEIEIQKETWLMLRKPCRLQTDGQTDGQGESSIPPPPTSLGGGIINEVCIFVCRLEVRQQFSFLDIYRQIRHFENDYHRFTAGFIKKSRHLKYQYQNAAFQKEQLVINYMQ